MEINSISNQPLTSTPIMQDKRPPLVTILCIIGFIGLFISLTGALFRLFNLSSLINASALSPVTPLWYSIFGMIWVILYTVALIFIWKMKRIGLISYSGLVAIEYIIGFTAGLTSIDEMIIPIIVIGLFWTQYKRMH